MKSDFPTLSYPNYYTLMTGLHTESHGMTGNYMYDTARNESFLIGTNKEQYHAHWWEGGEPIWVSATRLNKTCYMFRWPGCEVTIRGVTPTYCREYRGVPTLEEFRLDMGDSIQLLTNGSTNFTAVYYEKSDAVGHQYGPDSPELGQTLRDLDAVLSSFLDQIVSQKVNLILISDHGMTPVDTSRTIDLTPALTSDPGLYVTIRDVGAVVSIYTPDTGARDKVYSLLANLSPQMKVFQRSDIPERFHYKNGKYVADITCVADVGWTIIHPLRAYPRKNNSTFLGSHGYDNIEVDMRGIFYAVGPSFKPTSTVDYINAVDIYTIMCSIIGIPPLPNNGTADKISKLLALSSGPKVTCPCFTALVAVLYTTWAHLVA
ncbi:glycerophosphocholine cholinephosphodiesterase ENPP6-like isoform X3 [Physella acuta]|nr:glycerophosphocholine cholinephosphodiesterase ENPP6-like isoform X3 [Physella acuta]